MSKEIYNFNPGPSVIPDEVLRKIKDEFLDYNGTGLPIVSTSHRSKEFIEISETAAQLMKEILGLGDNYHVLFLGGGASTQFALVPMNFLHENQTAVYVDTGAWSQKAILESKNFGQTIVAASSEDKNYCYIPSLDNIETDKNSAYLHLTSNNTIFGTQIHEYPKISETPIICDMSSDIASRQMDYSQFKMIYAGAQKNLGAAGVTVAIIRDDFLQTAREKIPIMFKYKTHAEKKSLYNTPPVFSIYTVKLVLEWIKSVGGLSEMEKINEKKKNLIYSLLDSESGFYKGTAETNSRSWMNITFRLASEDLEKKFLTEATEHGFVGLKGHRSVGGIRVSLYNALPLSGAEKLADFMTTFKRNN